MNLKELSSRVLTQKETMDKTRLMEYENYFLANFVYNSAIMEKKIRVSFEEILNYQKFKTGALKSTNSFDATQICNLFNAHFYLEEFLQKKEIFTEEILKNVHEIVMKEIVTGGIYRNVDIRVSGSSHIPTRHEKVYDRMKRIFEQVESYTDDLEKVAFIHASIEKVHPFLDGNGRTNRLILNYLLKFYGYYPVVLSQKHKIQYFRILDQFKETKDIKPFAKFLSGLVEESIQDFENYQGQK